MFIYIADLSCSYFEEGKALDLMSSLLYYDSFLPKIGSIHNDNSNQNNNNSTLFHYDVNQPQNNHDKVPSKHNDQKNKIIVKNPVTWYMNIKEVLLKSKLNFLLIFLLPAIMKNYEGEEFILFFFYFLATIPLAKILAGSIKDFSFKLHPVNWILRIRIFFTNKVQTNFYLPIVLRCST